MKSNKNDGMLRDWQPGDGLRCRYATGAPPELPCGPPVKTQVRVRSAGPGRGDVEQRSPLCVNHARFGNSPGNVMAQARREATERLVAKHWDEYSGYLTEAIARLSQSREAS
jgi:hypothetical protein